jgi:hypothetical protein
MQPHQPKILLSLESRSAYGTAVIAAASTVARLISLAVMVKLG